MRTNLAVFRGVFGECFTLLQQHSQISQMNHFQSECNDEADANQGDELNVFWSFG